MKPARFLHLVAHRGDAAGHPENTLPAFQSALDLGVRFIDVDVQRGRERRSRRRARATRSSSGTTLKSIADLTAAELAQVDVSEPARFGERFKGTCIPRLVDVLSLLTKRPETTVFVTRGPREPRALRSRPGGRAGGGGAEAVPFPMHRRVARICRPSIVRARSVGFQIGWDRAGPRQSHTTQIRGAAAGVPLLRPRAAAARLARYGAGRGAGWCGACTTLEAALDLAARGADFVATTNVRALGEAMRAHASQTRNAEAASFPDEATTVARID